MKIMKIKNWKTFNENIQENLEDEFVEITFTENCEIEYYDQAFPGDSEEDIENLEPKYQEYFVSDKEEVDVLTDNENYLFVQFGDGSVGYIPKSCVDIEIK